MLLHQKTATSDWAHPLQPRLEHVRQHYSRGRLRCFVAQGGLGCGGQGLQDAGKATGEDGVHQRAVDEPRKKVYLRGRCQTWTEVWRRGGHILFLSQQGEDARPFRAAGSASGPCFIGGWRGNLILPLQMS